MVQNHRVQNYKLSHHSKKFNHLRFLEFIALRFKKSLTMQKFAERIFILTLNKLLYVMVIVPKSFGLHLLLYQRVLDERVFVPIFFVPNCRLTRNFGQKGTVFSVFKIFAGSQ
jgi:hypothetical protein